MRRFNMSIRSLRTATLVALLVVGLGAVATADDCLRPARGGGAGAGASLADLGEQALERLPWDTTIIRADLSADRPVAVAACYLTSRDLLVVSQTGMVRCMSRRDLTPRWVSALSAPLAAVPAEGPTHYAFLVKAHDGSYAVHAFSKRSGSEPVGFPVRLPFAASAGLAVDASNIYIASLGSPRDNKTVQTVSLATARVGWGWRTRGLVWADPVLDPSGNSLVVVSEDGAVTSLPAGSDMPSEPNWVRNLTGPASATPVVTPEHVVVGAQDGTLRVLDLGAGEALWFDGIDEPIRMKPWVFGGMEQVRRPSEVEGAPDVRVERYEGVVFVRNRQGFYAFDLRSGTRLLESQQARRPICRQGKWIVTIDRNRTLLFHDTEGDLAVEGRLGMQMFDLVATNAADGAIYACTHDGGIVAAIPVR